MRTDGLYGEAARGEAGLCHDLMPSLAAVAVTCVGRNGERFLRGSGLSFESSSRAVAVSPPQRFSGGLNFHGRLLSYEHVDLNVDFLHERARCGLAHPGRMEDTWAAKLSRAKCCENHFRRTITNSEFAGWRSVESSSAEPKPIALNYSALRRLAERAQSFQWPGSRIRAAIDTT